ncbi:helix-turn-helix domain-containing protein [Microbacterium sp. RD1]|uniref:helix-turn-helix domain-containing protein n=1 Tax=Microbacterium sp. RD1 TaxID=3457313 RepID=UPI003FA54715
MSSPSSGKASGLDEWQHVGARIREARRQLGMSARELAQRVGVTPQHVSQVERGLGSFSAAVLYSVASALDISLDSLFDDAAAETSSAASRARAADATAGRTTFEGGIVLRRADRPSLKLRSGPRWERLTAAPEQFAEFLEVVYPPSTEEATDSGLTRHEGREYGVILSGALHVEVGFDSTILKAGDSIAFSSSIPHRFRNASDGETRAIWFVNEAAGLASPETFHGAASSDDPSVRRYEAHAD